MTKGIGQLVGVVIVLAAGITAGTLLSGAQPSTAPSGPGMGMAAAGTPEGPATMPAAVYVQLTPQGAGGRADQTRIPLIGEEAPAFSADTTQGPIKFPDDYKGKWVMLFSHPSDFTPVCTTEIMTCGAMAAEFRALNCELVGLSIDGTASHIAWLRTIAQKVKYKDMANVQVGFPIIADLKMDVAHKYGMIQPTASDTKTVRAVFLIDPHAKIRALVYYPLTNGRNFQEIKRLLIAMQTTDKYGVATPADWQPGEDVIVHPPSTMDGAAERNADSKEYNYVDWFLCFKKMPKEMLTLAPTQK
jgi:peroxiredoxin (alkyl hydroperoxide reductase subunit C)